jgi:hypothetical protein
LFGDFSLYKIIYNRYIRGDFMKEISARERSLYLCAKELEESSGLKEDMAALDNEFAQDGLGVDYMIQTIYNGR